MLPAAARLTRRTDFERAVRRGRRAGRSRLVVHASVERSGTAARDATATGAGTRATQATLRVGFVVGRNVGGSVVRHRVQRRLRHVLRDRLGALPSGTLLVVRALPPAAGASSAELAADLDSALRRLGLVVGTTAATGAPCPS